MKVGFACGMFDLFHPGHVLMLQECKTLCDYLIIALNKGDNISNKINPGKRKPIYSLEERKLILQSSKYVDKIITYNSEEDLLDILQSFPIDIRFLGDDYKDKPITGEHLNMNIHYINRNHGYSTSSLIKKILSHHSKAMKN